MDIAWLEIWKFHGAALLAGCVIDWVIGDPVWMPHPVRLMGSMISGMETRLRRWMVGKETPDQQSRTGRENQPGKEDRPGRENQPDKEDRPGRENQPGKEDRPGRENQPGSGAYLAGTILAAAMCMFWWLVPWAVLQCAEYLCLPGLWPALLLAEGFFCSLMLAARGLFTESMKVCRSLEAGRTEQARFHVSMIVGRDTSVLDESGIARAAVETVAENDSDGVIAPFLFMALLGPAGGALYKAVNTMDSMIGYKNDRYLYFGRAAAKLDDLLNLVPARLTGMLMVLGAWLLPGMDGANAWKIYRRDRKQHASPNSAHGEAACAGALRLRLAGDAWYFGALHRKPYIGDEGRPIEPADIRRANYLMFLTEAVMMAVLALLIFSL